MSILPLDSADWPMWGFDSGRGFSTGMSIPHSPELLWTRQLASPERAWPFQYEDYFTGGNPAGIGKLSFDVSYEPVAASGRLFVPSMSADNITAYSADTGEELWRYYAVGPVRFAPVYDKGRLFFVSDDGFLYSLRADTGEMLWRFRGSFNYRSVLGNERLISIWPARGGPVIKDNIVYFAAGVLPFEGVFVHAVCADTGRAVWSNSTSGSIWDLHQHGGAWSYGGPSPQGYIAVAQDRVIVPGGRTPPAVYDRHTGEFLYFRQATGEVGKGAGGYRVSAWDGWFSNHGIMYSLTDGAQFGPVPVSVVTDKSIIGVDSRGRLVAHDRELEINEVEVTNRLGRGNIKQQYELQRLWVCGEAEDVERLYFRAGNHLGAGLEGGRAALLKMPDKGVPGGVVWEHDIEGEIWNMFAAGEKIYVVTEAGKIYCFGEKEGTGSPLQHRREEKPYVPAGEYAEKAGSIVARTGIEDGYAVFLGVEDGDLMKALADMTSLRIIAVDSDGQKVDGLRRRLDDAGYYGKRISVIHGDPSEFSLPPYIASLVVLSGGNYDVSDIIRAFNVLRPYGGKIYVHNPGRLFLDIFESAGLQNAQLDAWSGFPAHDHEALRDFAVISREGALPGSAPWTHQYAGASNRTYADDELVKPPLGVLWFGGPSNLNALPRHHNGPIPQVVGGRLFILGVDTISARCVYTGRELWVKELPGVGHPFTCLQHERRFLRGAEVYMPNHPGANFIGSPSVSVDDGIYVINGDRLLCLEPATGETKVEFLLPGIEKVKTREWGHLMVWEDLLVATIDPQILGEGEIGKANNWNATSSSLLLAMNRYDGSVLWARKAERIGFRHNAIAAGNGRLYVVDGLSESAAEIILRRGLDAETGSLLMSLDIRTGRTIWEREEGVFATWLGYYEDKDILLQGGRHGQRGVLVDEPRSNLLAHRGETGEVLWESSRRYSGPLSLHPDMIIPGNPGEIALEPETGEFFQQIHHPLTGRPNHNFTYHRYYGCGTMNASKYLIMFRSGAAGIADLLNFGGTANFGGFRAGCTNNLVAADGVLNAPDYTRTCTCSYQLQTSLGLVHTPGAEMWTLNRVHQWSRRIRFIGVNFGAPGNRKEDGVLWLEYPKIYRGGPDIPFSLKPSSFELFRNHSTWIENPRDGYAWVASYGAVGIENIRLDLVPGGSEEGYLYDITMYFAEPLDIEEGERVFGISVQGDEVFSGFDIVRQAGGNRRVATLTIEGVKVSGSLDIGFIPAPDSLPPVISGLAVTCAEEASMKDEEGLLR